jgi:hypothetical protein
MKRTGHHTDIASYRSRKSKGKNTPVTLKTSLRAIRTTQQTQPGNKSVSGLMSNHSERIVVEYLL